MKTQLKTYAAAGCAALFLLLQGCATSDNELYGEQPGELSGQQSVSKAPASKAPVSEVPASDVPGFPDMDKAWRAEGSFPLIEKLRLIGQGMSKDQMYELAGRPHFDEGVGANEWNYIYHFRVPGSNAIVTCRYKVQFEDKLTSSFEWAPAACADRLVVQPAAPVERIVERVVEKQVPTPAPAVSRTTLAADGMFAFGKSDMASLARGGREKLDAIAGQLTGAGVKVGTVLVTGHTDRIGSPQANLALSRARAETVKAYLAQKGVDERTIRAVGVGQTQPVTSSCTGPVSSKLIACLQPDRRVDVDVTLLR